ncbi:MAG: D-alanyl-D-alanine carboxypeptidase/D-alanyl-D-alanine-endopeptidase [Azonexus sp.]|jgi:D-alanyl-D-alanine carboxypeptidase/D-alanyl-D-alanine-endopeptidase (penicillin-binding protein 4)|nr:D-alanyl-D-alanine carboxypeptidase/D-alanyl-D-alanine-endopeptidase [Azonexus sp.]
MKRLFCSFALALAAVLAHAELPAPVLQALTAAQISPEAVGVVVQAVDAPGPLLEHNAAQPMNPASVMKLVTTYAALDLLGPAHVWTTTAASDNPPLDGVLTGNLYLKGSGDPRFVIEDLWALLRQLRARGIERLDGDIVLDASVFSPVEFNAGAFDNKPMRAYNVGASGLLINFQTLSFLLQPDAEAVRVLLLTPSEGLTLDNRLRRTDGACRSDWRDSITLRLVNTPPALDGRGAGPVLSKVEGGEGLARQRLEISGVYAAACGTGALDLAPLAPAEQASGLIRALWRELGGDFGGNSRGTVKNGRQPPTALPLASHASPPLAAIIRDINKYSNNVMARQLFLSLAIDAQGQPATTERAKQRVNLWLARRRLSMPELIVDNGSGLSRNGRISAASLNLLLQDAWRNPLMPEWIASLPIASIDGTMKKRLAGSPAAGRAHIKTGTINGVKAAAGYVLDTAGRYWTVTILINDPRAEAGTPAIDALLGWVAAGNGQ